MQTIIELLTPIILALASAALAWLVGWLQAKTKLDIPPSVQVRATEVLTGIIMQVERLAKTRAMDSSAKIAAALNKVDDLERSDPEVFRAVKGKAQDLIERLLISRITPDEVTPHGDPQ